MITLTTEQAQQIEEALSGWTGSLDEQAVVKIDEALATIRAARAQERAEQELVDGLNTALEALVYHTEQTRPIHKTNEAISQIKKLLTQGEAT